MRAGFYTHRVLYHAIVYNFLALFASWFSCPEMIIHKPISFYNQSDSFPDHRFKPNRAQGRHFSTWNVYPVQSQALANRNCDQMIFSFQFNAQEPGRRKYLVTELKTFYEEYFLMENKHYYELIHGSCHLYFDIEFELNNIDGQHEGDVNSIDGQIIKGNEMIQVFKDFVTEQLQAILGESDFKIIELDSTTRKKFSRHLVYRHPYRCFQSNLVVGHLVRLMLVQMSDSVKQKLNLNSDCKEFKCFVDDGVYTRNRNLRIWKSSKIEKGTKLEFLNGRALNFIDFEQSLVTSTKGLEYFDYLCSLEETSRIPKSSFGKNTTAATLVPSDEHYNLKCAILEISNAPSLILKALPNSSILIATLVGTRFCLNINREHRSNNVYFYIDLSSGRCHQRCFDLDCRRFRGPEYCIHSGERLENETLFEGIEDQEFNNINESWLQTLQDDGIFQGVSDEQLAKLENHFINGQVMESDIFKGVSDEQIVKVENSTLEMPDEEVDQLESSNSFQEISDQELMSIPLFI